MTFEDAVKEVAEELRTNRQGAYAMAVRLQNTSGHAADKLMAEAVKYKAPAAMAVPGADVVAALLADLPDAEALQTQVLSDLAEIYDSPSPETYALVNVFCNTLVAQREALAQALLGQTPE